MKMAFMLLLTGCLVCDVVRAACIGLNLSGGWRDPSPGPFDIAADDITGAVPQKRWNNWRSGQYQIGNGGTTPVLNDSYGVATTLQIALDCFETGLFQDDGPGPGNCTGGMQTLFGGKVREGNGKSVRVKSIGMPYSRYDLYIYAAQNETFTMTAGGSGVKSTTYTGIGSFVENGNYVKFSGCSGDFSVTGSGGYAVFHGFQIVGPDERPAGALLIIR